MTSHRLWAVPALLAIALSGCDTYPSPTRKTVVPSDIVGTWRYTCANPSATAEISFNADGNFRQTVRVAGLAAPMTREGHWHVEDNRIHLDQPLVYMAGQWQPFLLSWGFVDSSTRKGEVSILGGIIPDPDSDAEFSKDK